MGNFPEVPGTPTSGFWVTYKKAWEGPYNDTSNDDLPLEWFEFISHAAYADYLRMDKKNELAVMEERIAMQILDTELGKQQNQFNSQVTSRVSTYLSRSYI